MKVNIRKHTYLRILEDDGSLIRRPGLMLLAATTDQDPVEIETLYQMMCAVDQVVPPVEENALPESGQVLINNRINRNMKDRMLAGSTVREMFHHQVVTGKIPSLQRARDIVAMEQEKSEPKPRERTLLRRVEKAFSNYRGIVHFLAVLVYSPELISDAEIDIKACKKALGLARGIELFLDEHYPTDKWNLVRVPEEIPAVDPRHLEKTIIPEPLPNRPR